MPISIRSLQFDQTQDVLPLVTGFRYDIDHAEKKNCLRPGHSISYKIACSSSKDSDQPAPECKLISVYCLPADALILGCPQHSNR